MQLFTTAEAAAYLRLKERKIYEMVAEGTVPCTKVTGRWLFPKAELDHWLASSISRPAGTARPDPAPIVSGSHDPLFEWALRESGSGLATLALGSEAGFSRFAAGETIAAAIHLHALDDLDADANVAALRNHNELQDAVMIACCRREQGFLVAAGNPLKLGTIEDIRKKRARIAMRPKVPVRNYCSWRYHTAPTLHWTSLPPLRPSARPAPTSRRPFAPAVPIPALRRAVSQTQPGSISSR